MISNNKDGDIVEVKNSINNEITNTFDEQVENNIRQTLINFLRFFQQRYTKARIIIESIFYTYKNLYF